MPSPTETLVPALHAQVDDASLDRTVPRAFVHRAGPEAVWLTELADLGAQRSAARCLGPYAPLRRP